MNLVILLFCYFVIGMNLDILLWVTWRQQCCGRNSLQGAVHSVMQPQATHHQKSNQMKPQHTHYQIKARKICIFMR